MDAAPNQEYAHRENKDGTFDSICLNCFLTIASAGSESALAESEKLHICSAAVVSQNNMTPRDKSKR